MSKIVGSQPRQPEPEIPERINRGRDHADKDGTFNAGNDIVTEVAAGVSAASWDTANNEIDLA